MVGQQTLQQGLQWYLEEYLGLPIDNYKKHAEKIQSALSKWGRDCFDALFNSGGQTQNWYRDASQNDLPGLRLEIVSDDAEVLSWPWEALENEHDERLALQCSIERCLDGIKDPRPLSEELPKEQLNILYIIARSKGDVLDFQTQARPLIDFVINDGWPIHIDVLRPPTFKRLQEVLEEKLPWLI